MTKFWPYPNWKQLKTTYLMPAFDRLENIEGKALCFTFINNWDCVVKSLKIISFICYLTHSHTMTPFDALGKQAF